MGIAKLAAGRSKDPNTQVGACIVSEDNRILSIGYNGAPNNFSDDIFPWSREGDDVNTKYMYVCHAESNVIVFAARNGIPTQDSILYVTLSPCLECSKLIIGAGVKKVFYYEKYKDTRGLDLLQDVGVEVIQLNSLN